MKKMLSVIAMACCLFAAHAAIAYPIAGDGVWGDFEGDFSYDSTMGSLKIDLKNTSDPDNGGYLTAFVFNLPGNADVTIDDVKMSSSYNHFKLMGGDNFNGSIIAMPYGRYEIGASATNGVFEGGGKPDGIKPGESASFTFTFCGENLNRLTLDDFLTEVPSKPGNKTGSEFFVARFKGFDNDGSDKVPGSPVPVPAAAWLLGSGLIGLAGLKKMMR